MNAASFRPAEFSGGGLAQGALATAFGTGLGPGTGVSATVYPLASTLAGVGVRLTQGANSVNAYPVFVGAGQVNFLVPSNTPLGPTEVRVTYNNETSAPVTVQIVKSAFGLFTFSQGTPRAVAQNFVSSAETPVNLPGLPAKPGQTLIAYGTGLGPIAGADNVAAPAGDIAGTQVEILVGGVPARRLYAGRSPCCSGLDQIIFELPSNVPAGCTVPLVVRVDGVYSNLGDISISSDGAKCTDPAGGGGTQFCREGTYGWLHLGELYSQGAPQFTPDILRESTINLISAQFLRVSGCVDLPTVGIGSCTVLTSDSRPPQPQPTPPPPQVTLSYLDAGPELTLRSPLAEKRLLRQSILYQAPSVFPDSIFLAPGKYRISGTGGRDLGAFSQEFDFSPLRITIPNPGSMVDVSRPLTVTWSGGAKSDYFQISATVATLSGPSTIIRCTRSGMGAASFTFPDWTWTQIPAGSRIGSVTVLGASSLDAVTVPVPGLDHGLAIISLLGHTVQFEVR